MSLFAVATAALVINNLHTFKPERKTEAVIATTILANTEPSSAYQFNITAKERAREMVPAVKPGVGLGAVNKEWDKPVIPVIARSESPVIAPPAVAGKPQKQVGCLTALPKMPALGLVHSSVAQGGERTQHSEIAGSTSLSGTLPLANNASPVKDQHPLSEKVTAPQAPGAGPQSAVQEIKELNPLQPDSIQEDNTQKSLVASNFYAAKKWGIALYIAPENSHYEMRTKANQDLFTIAGPDRRAGNTLGINLSYSIAQNFYVQSGAWYAQKPAVSITESFIGYTPDSSGSTDTLRASYRNYTMQYQGRYLEVPLNIKYYCRLSNAMRIYVLAGMIASFNMPGSKSYFIRESYDQGEIYRDRVNLSAFSVGLAGHFAVGLEMRVNSSWSLYAEPFYKYSFSPVLKQKTYKNIPVEHFNRSWGAGFGIIYHFNKIRP